MSRRRSVAFIPVAVGALLGALGAVSVSAAPPTGTDASEVTHWNQVAATTLIAFPAPNGGAPPAFQINMGMVQGAVYDAVNAIGPKQHRQYLLEERAGAKASIDAAVATAAYDVLSNLVSTAPERAPFPGRAGLLTTLSTRVRTHRSVRSPITPSRSRASRSGTLAAKAMLDARVGDGRFGPSQWVPDTGVGHWQPLINPATGLPILDPTPWVGGVKPFLIQSSSQFRSVPPPALTARQWAAEFNEVKSLGRAASSTRTDDQTYIAKWWQSAPGLSWNEVARAAHRPERPRRRRQRETPRAAEPERGGRGDQLLERQVPLRLLAAVERDPTSVRRMGTPPRRRTRPGRRSSPRRIPSGSRGTSASTAQASPCCACSSATRRRQLLRSRAHVPESRMGRRCARSTRSRSRSPSSSRHASGLASTTAARTWPASCSARTSPTTRSRTTSSRSATDHRQGLLPGGRPTTARVCEGARSTRSIGRRRLCDGTDPQPPGVFGRLSGRPVSPT